MREGRTRAAVRDRLSHGALTPPSKRTAIMTRGRHPGRVERDATLHMRWGPITISRRPYTESTTPTLAVSAVHVCEPKPPPGETPIEWMLFTSEAVQTVADATAVVDRYRARWVIEEYIKALKTGCAFEKRQLTSLAGLVRALALFIPMAWRLLVLCHLDRVDRPLSVQRVFDTGHLLLLRKLLGRRRHQLPPRPTVRDAMIDIAALGGHITNNGAPGWLVLGRGLSRFLEAELGWQLARAEM